MKTRTLVYSTAALLLTAATLAAEPAGTNCVRSCCRASAEAAKPVTDKSLYQLENVWTNDDGKAVQLGSLRGRPQMIVMFFASCQYTCPLTVLQMQQIEASLPPTVRTNVGFTLVSFDSKRDTPAALRNYRTQRGLPLGNWTLLTGSPDSVLDLAAVLGVKFKEDAQGNFSHSNLITILNADGEIVFQQAGLNPDNTELIQKIEALTPALSRPTGEGEVVPASPIESSR